MEDIIQEIINIEKKSNEIIKESEEMKRKLSVLIEEKSLENIKAIKVHTKSILMNLYQDAEKRKDMKIKEIQEDLERKIDFINSQYKNNKIKLKENIYNKILGNY